MRNMINKKISIVIPSYNEEKYILPLYERLSAVLKSITEDYEIIFVNNGSYDMSEKIFEELTLKDGKVVVVSLSRNFGSQGAHSAGLSVADGDCAVCMDGDLQDPPELIEKFVAKWEEGFKVVFGVRSRRKGYLFKRAAYRLFYRILTRYSYVNIPLYAGDFALMDKEVYSILNRMPERDRFMRGLRAFVGFRQTGVEYVRDERKMDKPRYRLFDNFKMAYKWFFSFSYSPLQLISVFAFITSVIAVGGMVFYLYRYFRFHESPQGWMTITILVLFLGAVQLLSISIIGGYISRIFEEVKGRPNFIIRQIINKKQNY
jgi:dolichol-phosphate mannosyltransferase